MLKRSLFLMCLIFLLLANISKAAITTTSATTKTTSTAFSPGLKATYAWPTASKKLSSPFGPRLKASDDSRYDWHRGIDIPGQLDEAIASIANGTVYRTYTDGDPSSAYPDGGNVVVIKHTIPLNYSMIVGTSYDPTTRAAIVKSPPTTSPVTKFYSVYLHLNKILVNEGDPVTKGQNIGQMGHSGDTTFTHLHFEIRANTTCSLEAQINGQAPGATSCTTFYGYDPHINPIYLLKPKDATGPSLSTSSIGPDKPITITLKSTPEHLDVNRLEITNKKGTKAIIDFNAREGFDASHTETLDSEVIMTALGNIMVFPRAFNASSSEYIIDFGLPILASDVKTIKAFDTWGNVTSHAPTLLLK